MKAKTFHFNVLWINYILYHKDVLDYILILINDLRSIDADLW